MTLYHTIIGSSKLEELDRHSKTGLRVWPAGKYWVHNIWNVLLCISNPLKEDLVEQVVLKFSSCRKSYLYPLLALDNTKKKCTSWRSDMSLPSQNLYVRATTVCQSNTNAWVTSLETFWRENHPPKLSMASEHHCTPLCEQHCLLKLLHGPGAPVHHTVHWCTGHHLILWFNLWTIVHQCSTLEFSAPMQPLSALVQCSNAPVKSLNNSCYWGNTLYSFWLSMAQNVSVMNFNLLPYLLVYKSTFYDQKISPKNLPRPIHESYTKTWPNSARN